MTYELTTFSAADRPARDATQGLLRNQGRGRRNRPHSYRPQGVI